MSFKVKNPETGSFPGNLTIHRHENQIPGASHPSRIVWVVTDEYDTFDHSTFEDGMILAHIFRPAGERTKQIVADDTPPFIADY